VSNFKLLEYRRGIADRVEFTKPCVKDRYFHLRRDYAVKLAQQCWLRELLTSRHQFLLRFHLKITGVMALVQLTGEFAGVAVDHSPRRTAGRSPIASTQRPSRSRSCYGTQATPLFPVTAMGQVFSNGVSLLFMIACGSKAGWVITLQSLRICMPILPASYSGKTAASRR
jgi:hypothetical protein